MTDIAAILASYRSGQISEAEMVEICREWPEVEEALKATSIALTHDDRVQAAIDAFNADEPTEVIFGQQCRIYARKPIVATDCDYEIVTVSGVQGRRLP